MMNLPEKFKTYLQVKNASKATVKNYLADLNHFLRFVLKNKEISFFNIETTSEGFANILAPLFIASLFENYRNELFSSRVKTSTINRRLSSLRKLGELCVEEGWLFENPVLKVANIDRSPSSLDKFQKYLEKEKVSQVTVKNYLSDLRYFFNWMGEK